MRKDARFLVPSCGLAVAVLATVLTAQAPQLEVTQTDLTKIDKIRSVSLSLFGIALGDRTQAAEAKARAAGFRLEEVDASRRSGQVSAGFIRVFDSSDNEVFGIGDEGGTVTQLVLRSDLAPRLAGESSKLFEASIMEPESALRLRLLGREDNRTVEHPSGTYLTTITISYDKEGIRLTRSLIKGRGDLDPVIHWVMPAKIR
jgi:hypothetical protein